MASAPKYSIFIAFVGLLLLFSSMNEAQIGITELCEKPSQTWSGMCGNTGHCDNQCKEWEHASHGACHFRGSLKCFCYFETCN